MPDTMSSDAIQEDNPCSLSHVRTQPAHPASDITALREAVTAAFSSQDPSLPQSLSGRSPHSLQTVSYMPPGRTNTSSSTGLPMHQIDLRHPLQADGQAAKRLTYDGGQPELRELHFKARVCVCQ